MATNTQTKTLGEAVREYREAEKVVTDVAFATVQAQMQRLSMGAIRLTSEDGHVLVTHYRDMFGDGTWTEYPEEGDSYTYAELDEAVEWLYLDGELSNGDVAELFL